MSTHSTTVSSNIYKSFSMPLLCFALIIIIFINPMDSMVFARTALNLCSAAILPSLFPFFVLSGVITNSSVPQTVGRYASKIMRPLFKMSGVCSIPFVLSLFAGAPVGAVMTCELYEQGIISKEESERLICFTNNASPVFIVGALSSGFLGTPKLGYFLFGIHVLSAIILGCFISIFCKQETSPGKYLSLSTRQITFEVFSKILTSSINTVFYVCGCIVFFSVVSGPIMSFIGTFATEFPIEFKAIFTSCMEMTNGLHVICDSIKSGEGTLNNALPFISFMLGIGGLSVFVQVASVCSQHGLNSKKYLIAKILHGVIAFLLTKGSIFVFTYF